MSGNKQAPQAITFQRSFGSCEDDFGIPSSPPSGGSPWKLTVHRESSPTRAKTPDPSHISSAQTLSVPKSSPNMVRRASCPNFDVPEFSLAPERQSRLTTKRPSIISQAILEQFRVPEGVYKLSSSTIDEGLEVNAGESPCAVAHSETHPGVQPPLLNQRGFLASRMTSIFKPDSSPYVGSDPSAGTSVDGLAPAPSKKKSYLMKRAAAITNTDVNAMAPSSM